ncbi:MAG: exodeoxyribonuclease VII large subunit [Candidatus Paceibacteria bacterium]
MSENIVSVSQYIEYINQALRPFNNTKVEGEVTDFSINRQKWVSFDLKDEEDEQILPCFTSYGLFQQQGLDDVLEDGMRVQILGEVKVRDKGHFSMFVKSIDLAGEGTLQKAYEKLKKKLKQEGVFSEDRKRNIPDFPQKIGVITSPEARAYTDFLKVLKHRMGGLDIYLLPVHVQGENAVREIQQAFTYIQNSNLDLDLVVLTRGGGSLEDLQAFNSEEVVRSVFSTSVPVVCGVGHQEDETLAGLASDLRASTPSNAAELIVRDRENVVHEVDTLMYKLGHQIEQIFKQKRERINRFYTGAENYIKKEKQNFKNMLMKLNYQLKMFSEEIQETKQLVDETPKKLNKELHSSIQNKSKELKQLQKLLKSYSPQSVLDRGYSIVKDGNGNVLKNTKKLDINDIININLSQGELEGKVTKIINN